jgi:hypothetical protein
LEISAWSKTAVNAETKSVGSVGSESPVKDMSL